MVGKALTAITARLQSLSQFDGTESKVGRFFLFLVRLKLQNYGEAQVLLLFYKKVFIRRRRINLI